MRFKALERVGLLIIMLFASGGATAGFDLRVESRPNTGPIEAYAWVTNDGDPVTGLTAEDFAVTLDGAPIDGFSLSLPPAEDPGQHLSVALVLPNGPWPVAVPSAASDFISQMAIGDYAAVVSTTYSPDPDLQTIVVQPFTQIDGGSGTSALLDSLTATSRPAHSKVLESLMRALSEFQGPLPDGPKAIVIFHSGWSLGIDQYSLDDVVSFANQLGIPIFTIYPNQVDLGISSAMKALAADTGATHLPVQDIAYISDASRAVRSYLRHGYRIQLAADAVTDCNPHMLVVATDEQTAGYAFSRCDTTPEPFGFEEKSVAPGALVTSDAAVIAGVEGPTSIEVEGGTYSIGCGTEFTDAPLYILPGEAVCVRHTASQAHDFAETILAVGGVSARFISVSDVLPPPPPPPPPPDGGSGAVGLVELMLALSGLLAMSRRRRH